MEQPEPTLSVTLDKSAYQSIFDDLYQPLCAFAYSYIGDTATVEDLVQEAFVALWEARENFNHYKMIKSFLYTTSRNKCLNHLKHQKVVERHEKTLIQELESDEIFSQHVIEQETFNLLYREIELLPESAKRIMFFALRGLKNKEIAEELSISENTVKTQKKIAYSKIKQNLGPVLRGIFLAI